MWTEQWLSTFLFYGPSCFILALKGKKVSKPTLIHPMTMTIPLTDSYYVSWHQKIQFWKWQRFKLRRQNLANTSLDTHRLHSLSPPQNLSCGLLREPNISLWEIQKPEDNKKGVAKLTGINNAKKKPWTPTIKGEGNKWQLFKKYMNLTLATDTE